MLSSLLRMSSFWRASLLASVVLVAACGGSEKVESDAPVGKAADVKASTGEPAEALTESGVPSSFVKEVTERFKSVKPELAIVSVEKTGVEGMYQVTFDKAGSIYALGNGDHFIAGDLMRIENSKFVDVKSESLKEPRMKALASIPRDEMIIFSPVGEVKASISVFTDVDCGYCRKLHNEVAQLNEMGVEVRYLAYPRAGIGSGSYKKIASAWCADDPNEAIAKLKNGESIPIAVCDNNPVAQQYELGGRIGVTGTPAIFLETGKLLPGYLPADRLAQELGI
ncbi:MAG: protein-disulfide isomerase [Alteromonadaceae bacterium]|nr:MAG: protein-disulfide isomerase [Alteromonadaceae bacterium]